MGPIAMGAAPESERVSVEGTESNVRSSEQGKRELRGHDASCSEAIPTKSELPATEAELLILLGDLAG